MKYIWNKPMALILDTNIWLNFLKGGKEEINTFRKMKKMMDQSKIILFTPEQVMVEWNHHHKHILQQTFTTTKDTLDQAKLLIKYFYEPTNTSYRDALKKIQSQINLNTDIQNPDICKDIEHIINNKVTQIKLTDPQLKNMVIEFGLNKKKPFGHKNSMGDAVIFFSIYENFSNKIRNKNQYNYNQLYFVTNDVHDFSEKTNGEERDVLHPDLKKLADEIDLNYSSDIHATIRRIDILNSSKV